MMYSYKLWQITERQACMLRKITCIYLALDLTKLDFCIEEMMNTLTANKKFFNAENPFAVSQNQSLKFLPIFPVLLQNK